MENTLIVSCLLTMSAIKLTTTAFPLADITEDPIFQVVDLKRSKGKYTGKPVNTPTVARKRGQRQTERIQAHARRKITEQSSKKIQAKSI